MTAKTDRNNYFQASINKKTLAMWQYYNNIKKYSNYSHKVTGGLFLYFLNFSGQPSFYTEL